MDGSDRFASLWNDYLEGELDTDGEAELRALLLGSEALQRQAADLYRVHRLLGFSYQEDSETGEAFVRSVVERLPSKDDDFVKAVMQRVPASAPTRRRSMVQVLGTLACGLLVGAILTSAAWVYATPLWTANGASVSLLDEGFEAGPPPLALGIPTRPGVWSGDFSEIVGDHQQVTPASNKKMLRLLRADTEKKPNPAGYVTDLYRLVDVRPHRKWLEDGSAVVQLSVGFNASTFPEHEKYQSSIFLYAMDAQTATDGSTLVSNGLANDSLAFSRSSRLTLDRQPETWQRLSGELRLPPGTEYVLVRIGVGHATPAQRRPDFPGQYLDDIRLVLVRRSPLP